uniref:Uncharacterized protein n=1 Tax=Romanomermis culicivorax TaxID=13658 RepID=A0A915I0Q1_ROMCU
MHFPPTRNSNQQKTFFQKKYIQNFTLSAYLLKLGISGLARYVKKVDTSLAIWLWVAGVPGKRRKIQK